MRRCIFALGLCTLLGAGCQQVLGIENVGLRDGGGVLPDAGVGSGIQTVILLAPPKLTNETQASFGFTANGGFAGFECSTSGASAFAICESPHQVTVPEGEQEFQVRALDGDGLPGPAVSYSWTVDLTGPAATITSIEVVGSVVTFNFGLATPEVGATLECSLNGGAFDVCTTGSSQTLGDGDFVFRVRGKDQLGNVGATPAQMPFMIDTGSPPEATITQSPSSLSNETSPVFSFNSSQSGSTFDCSIDMGAFQPCTSGAALSPLGEGVHNFAVRATDGNGTSVPATYSWTIDLTPPITSFNSKPGEVVVARSASLEFLANEVGSTFGCVFDGGAAISPCPTPFDVNLLSTGAHSLSVVATDPAGNVGVATVANWDVAIIAFASAETNGAMGAGPVAAMDAGISGMGGGRAGADTLCSNAASGPAFDNLEVHAVLCVTTGDSVANMAENFSIPIGEPVASLGDVVVSRRWADFIGENPLENTLNDAVVVPSNTRVWMGCEKGAQTLMANTCANWNDDGSGFGGSSESSDAGVGSDNGSVAAADTTSSDWLQASLPAACSDFKPVLCVAY